jgi:hypothetical protein
MKLSKPHVSYDVEEVLKRRNFWRWVGLVLLTLGLVIFALWTVK